LYDALYTSPGTAAPLASAAVSINTLGIEESSTDPFWIADRTIVFPRFIDDGKYLMRVELQSNQPVDPNGFVSGVVNNASAYRMPAMTTKGCTVTRFVNYSDEESVNLVGSATVNATWKQSTCFVINVNTTSSAPVAMVQFGLSTIWPVQQTSGKIRVIISRIPDILTV
jgi:hypothetical protein